MRGNYLKSAGAIGLTALLLVLFAFSAKVKNTDRPAAATTWTQLVNAWIESDMKAQPQIAAYQGRHEYDGLFPDWSPAGLAAEIQRLHNWRVKTAAVDPATLSESQQFERKYLLAVIDGRLFWQESADWPHRNPAWYYFDPAVYLDRPYADLVTRMKAYTRWASNLPAAAAQIKTNLAGPLPSVYIDAGINTFGALSEFLKTDVIKVFAGAGDAAERAEFMKQNTAAAAALADLHQYMHSLRATQTDDFSLGPALFAKMLYATERVDTPLDVLENIGEKDLQRNQIALTAACAAYAPDESVTQCVAHVTAAKPDGDCVAYVAKQLIMLRQFVLDRNIVSIPAGEEATVKQSPPYNTQNSAYIAIPGPYEKNMPAFYNVTMPDPSWSKQQQLANIPGKADLLFTSVHEVWPGHFLQFLHSNLSPSPLGRLYVGYAFAEGWAHYAEEMMWEEGLGNGDPQIHIGELLNALLRDVRLLSSIGMHTGGLTLDESELMFLELAYQDEGSAELEAARGAYDPSYLNYTLGKLMIRRLRADWCGARGGADNHACWHDFHDAFLSYGGPPIPLVRGAMLGESAGSAF